MPTPWGDSLYHHDPEGTVLERMRDAQMKCAQALREQATQGTLVPDQKGTLKLLGIAPDREWSRPDIRRVFLIDRPAGPFASYNVAEYAFPVDSLHIVEMTEAFYLAPQQLSHFESFRIERGAYREFFVCTDGHADICCARFGIPLYQQTRKAFPQVRAWRMTHIGGHKYAPTAWEYPSGYKWAFLDKDATRSLIEQDGSAAALGQKVRGWSGVPTQVQMLDRVGLKRYGWQWMDFNREGQVLEEDTEARRSHVRLTFEAPDGARGAYEGTVVVGRELPNFGCGLHWGEYDSKTPEYALENLRTSAV
jgi:hypothetical protein